MELSISMHSVGVIHGDMQPRHVGVKEDCTLKILDLDSAHAVGETYTPCDVVHYYGPPEAMIIMIQYNENIVMWPVGCIFAEMVRGEILLCGRDYNIIDHWNRITKVLGMPPADFSTQLSPEARAYTESQPEWSWMEIFPDNAFPNNTPEDKIKTQHA